MCLCVCHGEFVLSVFAALRTFPIALVYVCVVCRLSGVSHFCFAHVCYPSVVVLRGWPSMWPLFGGVFYRLGLPFVLELLHGSRCAHDGVLWGGVHCCLSRELIRPCLLTFCHRHSPQLVRRVGAHPPLPGVGLKHGEEVVWPSSPQEAVFPSPCSTGIYPVAPRRSVYTDHLY